jgi:putative transposase
MPNYRRAKIKGGVFLFTVVLEDRSSDLLIKQINQSAAMGLLQTGAVK